MQGDDAVVGLQLRELTRSKSSFARCSDTSVGGAGVGVCEGSEEDEDEGDEGDKEDEGDEGDERDEEDEGDEGDEGDEEY